MLDEAERRGDVKPGALLIEATAGNTGIAICRHALAKKKGYRLCFTCPEKTSQEKRDLLRAFGAQIIVCPNVKSSESEHFQNVARRMADATENAFFFNQFDNEDNALAHLRTTGPEIIEQLPSMDTLALAAGTGGTLSGVSNALFDDRGSGELRVFNVEVEGQAACFRTASDVEGQKFLQPRLLTEEEKGNGATVIEGVGPGRLYRNLIGSKVTDVVKVSDEEAISMARFLAREEGLFVGGSSGINACGAVKAARVRGGACTVLSILCEDGSRNLNKIFNDDWLRENGFEKVLKNIKLEDFL